MSVDTYFIIVAVAVLFILTEGKLTGKCTDYKYPTKDKFDVERYLGMWYVIGNFHSSGKSSYMCLQAVYTDGPDGTIGIVKSGLGPDGENKSVSATGYYDSVVKSKLTIRPTEFAESSYWVLDTDYDTYSIVWSCTDLPVHSHFQVGTVHSRARITWILGRKRTMEPAVVKAAKQTLEDLGIYNKQFTATNQTNC